MYIVALFTIAKNWKQPKRPSPNEWKKKMEYYSSVKKSEIMPFATTWIDLEIIILNEVSQTKIDKYHLIALICGI